MKDRLLISSISLFFLTFLPSCGQSDAQHNPKHPPIQGKIIFNSNREAPKDAIEQDGIKKGILSLYLWENGKITKFFEGGSYPRWSPDGERIACILWEEVDGKVVTGSIGILNKDGKLLQKIRPRYSALRFEWSSDGNKIIYVGWPWELTGQSPMYLSSLDVATLEEEEIYRTSPSGDIHSMNWNTTQKFLVLDLSDRLGDDKQTMSHAAFFDPASRKLSTFYEKIGVPILLSNGNDLLFTTNWTPDGKKIEQFGWGALVKYNLETKEFEVIRPTGWVRNMRLSRDGKYLYTSEPVERDGYAIHIYSVENLKTPIYVIPSTAIYGYNDLSYDLNPDWLPE